MKNNLNLTLTIAFTLSIASYFIFGYSISGFFIGILYAQVIEWFVHGWIQHHPFKIFKAYRDNHTYHHKHPRKPLAVQPIQYFLIGSIILLLPLYWYEGIVFGYVVTYYFINVIHYDLHSDDKILPAFIWNIWYFRKIDTHHFFHHTNIKPSYTTYSVTNPFIDILFTFIKVNKLNNWIAKLLKI